MHLFLKGLELLCIIGQNLYKSDYESDVGKISQKYTTGEGGKLDGVATLVTDLARGYSTTKQNPHMCHKPLYGAII